MIDAFIADASSDHVIAACSDDSYFIGACVFGSTAKSALLLASGSSSSTFLSVYPLSSSSSSSSSSSLCLSSSSRAVVVQLIVLEAVEDVSAFGVVLLDNEIVMVSLPKLERVQTNLTSLIGNPHQISCITGFHQSIAVFADRRLIVLKSTSSLSFEIVHNLIVNEAHRPICFAKMDDSTICFANAHQYSILDISSSSSSRATPLHHVPLEGAMPCCALLPNQQAAVLVSTNAQIGLFVSIEGHALPQNPVIWSSSPLQLCVSGEYVLALLHDGVIEVFNVDRSVRVQSIASQDTTLHTLCLFNDCVLRIGRSSVSLLRPSSVPDQIDQYIDVLRIDEAFALLEKQSSSLQRKAQLEAQAAKSLFSHLYFDEAMARFRASSASIRDVIDATIGIINDEKEAAEATTMKVLIHNGRSLLLQKIDAIAESSKRRRNEIQELVGRSDNELISEALHCVALELWRRRRPFNRINDDDDDEDDELELLDTSLLSVFVEIDELPLAVRRHVFALEDLLLPSNHCDRSLCESLLRRRLRLDLLADFFISKHQTRMALECWRQMALESSSDLHEQEPCSSSSAYSCAQSTLSVLSQLQEEDLVFEFSAWMLRIFPVDVVHLFTSSQSIHDWKPHQIISFIENVQSSSASSSTSSSDDQSDDPLQLYLEHIVSISPNSQADVHQRLADLYLEKVLKILNDNYNDKSSRIEALRKQLAGFLKTSSLFDAVKLLSRLDNDPSSANDLQKQYIPKERLLLLGKAGFHKEALTAYVLEMADIEEAISYCCQQQRANNNMCLFSILIDLLLNVQESLIPDGLSRDSFREMALKILNEHASKVAADPIEIMRILPGDIPLTSIAGFLTKFLPKVISNKRLSQITRALHRSQHIKTELNLVERTSLSVSIREDTVCKGCSKSIGNEHIVSVSIDTKHIYHYRCAKAQQQSSASASSSSPLR